MQHHLCEVIEEAHRLRAELRGHANVRRALADDYRVILRESSNRLRLLKMTEALIVAHRLAKIDDNGLTLDLVEDALRHVGGRLANEV